MKSSLILSLCLLLSLSGFTQMDERIASAKRALSDVQQITLPIQDNKKLYDLELAARQPGRAPKFAEPISVNITPEQQGSWETLANGNELWRLRVQSKGAKSLNLGFTTFHLPTSASLILYTPDYQTVRGPFTPADNEEHTQLWTPVIGGDELVIELQVAPSQRAAVQLALTSINHDFLGFVDPASGTCNLDVICGAGDGWEIVEGYRDIIQSVAMYSIGGVRACTGFLVNNERRDCTPYFMTADHCGVTANAAPSIVTYWNFESPTCRQPNTAASGNVNIGSLELFNTGATLRATAEETDFTLIELDDAVPEEANAYYAGWNATEYRPAGAVCVHHPGTDEKRISFEDDPLDYSTRGGTINTTGAYHRVDDWDIGTTEGGSSGSPLFDPTTRQVIGQLFGGLAACGNSEYDVYGRFDLSYVGNGTPEASLRFWLDPDDTGITEIEGRWAQACSFFVETETPALEFCQTGTATYVLTVSESFGDTVRMTVDSTNLPADTEIIFSEQFVQPGSTTTLTIPSVENIPAGEYTIVLNGTDGVDSVSTVLSLAIFGDIPTTVVLASPADAATNVSLLTTLNWETQGAGVTYDVEIATDPAFEMIVDTVFGLRTNEFSSTELDAETTYFWRVRATNTCGDNQPSDAFQFTTAQVVCSPVSSTDLPVVISEGPPDAYTSTLTVPFSGEIVDLNVSNLRGEHTWISDLGFTLTSPSGTTVIIVNPSCFDEDDFNISLDDSATGDLPCPYNDGGTYRPSNALATFNGENPQGVWTLTIVDGASQDGGQLLNWELDICAAVLGDFTAVTTLTEADLCIEDELVFGLQLGQDFSAESFVVEIDNLPQDAVVDFGTERPQPGDNLTVTINNFQPGTKGMYNLTITATDGEDTALAFVDLTLDEAPNATILTLPANGATDVTSTPTLRFSNVVLSDGYLVEIATDAAFDNIVVSDVSERVSYEAVLELDTEYFWRVTTQNNCGTRISEVFSFTTMKDLAVIASATELEVCTGEAVTFTVSLGESFAMEGAEISVSSDDLPTTATVSYSLNPVPAGGTTDVRIEGLSDQFVGTLNLTVMADDGENNNSTTISVTVTDAPANTNLQSPANNETVFLQDVSLEWSVVDDATAYLVEVAQDANFANVISSERLTANTWTVSLEPGMFFWRVTTFNACGENSTDAFAFIVQSNSTKEIAAFDFDIAPNPAQAGFSLRFNQLPNTDIQIRLMGVDGKLWQEVDLANNALIYYFDTAALASGVYFLQLQTSTGMTTRKLVIR